MVLSEFEHERGTIIQTDSRVGTAGCDSDVIVRRPQKRDAHPVVIVDLTLELKADPFFFRDQN